MLNVAAARLVTTEIEPFAGPFVKTHAAPALKPPLLLSPIPPTMAVVLSPERAIEVPCSAFPTAPPPSSLVPCCDQTPALRVHTHAAPEKPLSHSPPTMAVFPSADRETDAPWQLIPTPPEPTNFGPC